MIKMKEQVEPDEESKKEKTLQTILDEATKSTENAINQYKATNKAITDLLSPTKFQTLDEFVDELQKINNQ